MDNVCGVLVGNFLTLIGHFQVGEKSDIIVEKNFDPFMYKSENREA
jgi:hypothetical protein